MAASYAKQVEQYCQDVESGRRVAGKLERAAVARYRRDLEHASERGFRFDEKRATRAIDFIHRLHLTEGEYAGQPMRLRPWQLFIVWNIFGWMAKATGFRRFRKA